MRTKNYKAVNTK